MNQKKTIWIFALISITLLLVSLTSCSQKTTFRDETISSVNMAEILSKANTELTVEEARLLEQYLKRSYPQLAENDLPAGRTLNQMIEEERIVESTRPAQEAADATEVGSVICLSLPLFSSQSAQIRLRSLCVQHGAFTNAYPRWSPMETPGIEPGSRVAPNRALRA